MILSNNEINSLFSDILGSNMNSYYKTSLVTKNLGEENYEMNLLQNCTKFNPLIFS